MFDSESEKSDSTVGVTEYQVKYLLEQLRAGKYMPVSRFQELFPDKQHIAYKASEQLSGAVLYTSHNDGLIPIHCCAKTIIEEQSGNFADNDDIVLINDSLTNHNDNLFETYIKYLYMPEKEMYLDKDCTHIIDDVVNGSLNSVVVGRSRSLFINASDDNISDNTNNDIISLRMSAGLKTHFELFIPLSIKEPIAHYTEYERILTLLFKYQKENLVSVSEKNYLSKPSKMENLEQSVSETEKIYHHCQYYETMNFLEMRVLIPIHYMNLSFFKNIVKKLKLVQIESKQLCLTFPMYSLSEAYYYNPHISKFFSNFSNCLGKDMDNFIIDVDY